jgi:hypothetical protein
MLIRIPVRIPVGTTYTITTQGSVWKAAKCESCGCEYAYKLKNTARGQATNYLWLNKERTIALAKKRSQQQLKKALESSDGVFSCPACGRYPKQMVNHMKGKRWKTITDVIVFVIIMEVFAGLIIYTDNKALAQQLFPFLVGGVLALVVILIPVGLLYIPPKNDPRHTAGRAFSESYPVMRREQMEQIAAQARAQGKAVELPKWPGK